MTKFYVMRHCESTSNNGENDCKDSPLSQRGIQHANTINGVYDLVILSPLRRTYETLQHSTIIFTDLFKTDLCRERIFHIRDLKQEEDDSTLPETDIEYDRRVNEFRQLLAEVKNVNKYGDVLIVSHAYFCASLGAYGIKNGEIRQIYV